MAETKKQHLFDEVTDRCLFCDVHATDPDANNPCENAPYYAPDFDDEDGE